MLKRTAITRRYIYWVTKKPLFFYAFLLLGTALFLWLTLTTRISASDGDMTLFNMIFAKAGRGL